MGIFDQNQQPVNRGGSGRWIIAICIALIGFFMYMNQVEINPVTGEKQHVMLSPSQEVKLGLQSAPEMAREMGGEVSANDPRLKVVEEVGNLLVSKIELANSPWQFKFHLLADTETVNAFALPGGQIFITLGLYNDLKTEAQLAGVLGHEMGHVIERHTAQQMAKSQLGQYFVTAVATGASDGTNNNSSVAVAAMVNQMFQLRYSRGDESASDIWGLKLLEKANLDPRAMITVMNVLKEASKDSSRTMEMFQTHPNPDLRIQQIDAYLREHPPAKQLTEGRSLKAMQSSSSF